MNESSNSRGISQILEPTTAAKRMKEKPVFIKCIFQWCIDDVDIAERSSTRRRQTRAGWGKQAIFEIN